MLITTRTKQALELFRSYARMPDQKMLVDDTFRQLLAENDSEDYVVLAVVGYIQDGLRFGNWIWNMPPSVQKADKS